VTEREDLAKAEDLAGLVARLPRGGKLMAMETFGGHVVCGGYVLTAAEFAKARERWPRAFGRVQRAR